MNDAACSWGGGMKAPFTRYMTLVDVTCTSRSADSKIWQILRVRWSFRSRRRPAVRERELTYQKAVWPWGNKSQPRGIQSVGKWLTPRKRLKKSGSASLLRARLTRIDRLVEKWKKKQGNGKDKTWIWGLRAFIPHNCQSRFRVQHVKRTILFVFDPTKRDPNICEKQKINNPNHKTNAQKTEQQPWHSATHHKARHIHHLPERFQKHPRPSIGVTTKDKQKITKTVTENNE